MMDISKQDTGNMDGSPKVMQHSTRDGYVVLESSNSFFEPFRLLMFSNILNPCHVPLFLLI